MRTAYSAGIMSSFLIDSHPIASTCIEERSVEAFCEWLVRLGSDCKLSLIISVALILK